MEIKYDKPRLWKKIVRGLLDILAALLLLLSVFTSMIVHGVFNSENCKNAICNEEFDLAVEQAIVKSLNASNSTIELNTQKLVNDIDMTALVSYAREYTADFIDSVFSAKPFEPKTFNNEKFTNAVLAQLQPYSEEMTMEEIQEVCDEATLNMQSTLRYIPNIVINQLSKLSSFFVKLQFLKKIEIPLYIFTAIAIIGNIIFGGKSHRLDVFFGISSAMWITFATVLVPFVMLAIYDIPSKIAVGESLFLYLIKGLNRAFVVNPAIILGAILCVVSVALAISIALIIKRKVVQSEKEEKYTQKHKKTVDKTEQ